MSKHTPGPWDFEPPEEQSVRPTIASVGDYRIVRDGHGVRGYDEHGHDEDDARLIAASPELLEALQALFDDYKALADSGDAGFWKLEELAVGKKALAAIAKAEGMPW